MIKRIRRWVRQNWIPLKETMEIMVVLVTLIAVVWFIIAVVNVMNNSPISNY